MRAGRRLVVRVLLLVLWTAGLVSSGAAQGVE